MKMSEKMKAEIKKVETEAKAEIEKLETEGKAEIEKIEEKVHEVVEKIETVVGSNIEDAPNEDPVQEEETTPAAEQNTDVASNPLKEWLQTDAGKKMLATGCSIQTAVSRALVGIGESGDSASVQAILSKVPKEVIATGDVGKILDHAA